jgi:hypothetical protein
MSGRAMEPRRGDKMAWIVALLAAAIVVIVVLMNGDALERLFTPRADRDSPAPPTTLGDGGRLEVR